MKIDQVHVNLYLESRDNVTTILFNFRSVVVLCMYMWNLTSFAWYYVINLNDIIKMCYKSSPFALKIQYLVCVHIHITILSYVTIPSIAA